MAVGSIFPLTNVVFFWVSGIFDPLPFLVVLLPQGLTFKLFFWLVFSLTETRKLICSFTSEIEELSCIFCIFYQFFFG